MEQILRAIQDGCTKADFTWDGKRWAGTLVTKAGATITGKGKTFPELLQALLLKDWPSSFRSAAKSDVPATPAPGAPVAG